MFVYVGIFGDAIETMRDQMLGYDDRNCPTKKSACNNLQSQVGLGR
jgi:hypothetical protein